MKTFQDSEWQNKWAICGTDACIAPRRSPPGWHLCGAEGLGRAVPSSSSPHPVVWQVVPPAGAPGSHRWILVPARFCVVNPAIEKL